MPETTPDLREQIAAILEEVLGVQEEPITPEQHLARDLDVDSLTMIEIVIGIEEQLGIVVPDAKVAELDTVGAVLDWVAGQPAG